MATREERATLQRFAERYRDVPTDVTEVCGAHGYTTMSQAKPLEPSLFSAVRPEA